MRPPEANQKGLVKDRAKGPLRFENDHPGTLFAVTCALSMCVSRIQEFWLQALGPDENPLAFTAYRT